MFQCPRCYSHNDVEAAFCSQCGARLEAVLVRGRPAATRRRKAAAWVGGFVVTVLAVVVVLVQISDAPPAKGPHSATLGKRPRASPELKSVTAPPVENTPPELLLAEDGKEPRALDRNELSGAVSKALVVLELRDRDDHPLRELRGVLVDASGVVLCRFQPLLGAYGGVCRLSTVDEGRAPIIGLSSRVEALDLALLRLEPSPQGYPAVPLLASNPSEILGRGDLVYTFSDYKSIPAAVLDASYTYSDGLLRVRLAAEPPVPPEAFLAVDSYGFVVGLCRQISGVWTGQQIESCSIIDPTAALAGAVERPAAVTLQDLTNRLYDGTFPDFFSRGSLAMKQKHWLEAARMFEQALSRVPQDSPDAADVLQATDSLLAAYLEEVRRLLYEANRTREAALLAETVLARFSQNAELWLLLGEARLVERNFSEAILALAQAQELEPGDRVNSLLEKAYLSLAGDAARSGDSRYLETTLTEGLRRLPRSGPLYLELAKLYIRLEAYDDASRLLAVVPELDPSLRVTTDDLLERVDQALKRRDALIIPIASDLRSYKTQAVINGSHSHTFIIDTGATYTTIPSDLAAQLGYDTSHADRIQLSTAAGLISVPLLQVESFSIGSYSVRNLKVVVLPTSLGPPFGLLGLNFLKHFKYTVDASRNEFRLERP